MRVAVSDTTLNILAEGPQDAPTVVFAHPLGTDLNVWDAVCAQMPSSLRIIRYDARGHGASDAPPAPYKMGQLVRDAEQLLDHLQIKNCVFVGAGLGGLIAQGLAVKRLDQLRAMVLCGTAAKLGRPEIWDRRIQQITDSGFDDVGKSLQERSFTRAGRTSEAAQTWARTLQDTPTSGYIGTCHAISGTDFYTPTSGLRLPSLGLCGVDDRITPPDLMRETLSLIPGARLDLIRRAGHYPMLEAPTAFAAQLLEFLSEIGHV